jgi:hypothetical protein
MDYKGHLTGHKIVFSRLYCNFTCTILSLRNVAMSKIAESLSFVSSIPFFKKDIMIIPTCKYLLRSIADFFMYIYSGFEPATRCWYVPPFYSPDNSFLSHFEQVKKDKSLVKSSKIFRSCKLFENTWCTIKQFRQLGDIWCHDCVTDKILFFSCISRTNCF